MKNNINYFYDLITYDIHQENNDFIFTVESQKYILYEYTREEIEIPELYVLNTLLNSYGLPFHKIVLNKNNQIITEMDDKKYVLVKLMIEKYTVSNQEILMNSIIINQNFEAIKRTNWYELWSKKIDNIERLVEESGDKYHLIRESINYYIGLAENALMITRRIGKNKICIEHRILNDLSSYTVYNPLNLVLDNKTRDLSNLIKYFAIYKEEVFDNISLIFSLENNEKICLLARMMFPDYYFNMVEEIINKNKKENDLKIILDKKEKIEEIIIYIYSIVKVNYNDLDIEWIKKVGY